MRQALGALGVPRRAKFPPHEICHGEAIPGHRLPPLRPASSRHPPPPPPHPHTHTSHRDTLPASFPPLARRLFYIPLKWADDADDFQDYYSLEAFVSPRARPGTGHRRAAPAGGSPHSGVGGKGPLGPGRAPGSICFADIMREGVRVGGWVRGRG